MRASGVAVLIVDCLGPLLAVLGLKESENVDVGRWLAAFELLLAEAGIGEALIVHHMGHDGERSRGASRLRDWPDAEWRLLRGRDNDDGPDVTRYFAATGRDVDVAEGALSYDPMFRRVALTGGSRNQTQTAKDVPRVVEWVRANPGQSVRILEAAHDQIGISRDRCRKARLAAVRGGDLCVHKGPTTSQNHYVKTERAECAEACGGTPAH